MSFQGSTRLRCGQAFLVAVALAAAASPASPFELFGRKFFEHADKKKDEDTIGKPQHYSVDFHFKSRVVTVPKALKGKDLEKALKAASGLWADRKKPASGVAGLLAKARSDYRSLLSALYAQGRYGGSISILVNGKEAADLPPDATLPDPVKIAIDIDPGPAFLFSKTTILNQAPPTADRRDKVETPAHAGFAPGQLARSTTILKADRLATAAWRQQGYAKAKIAEQRVVAAHDTDTVDATLKVDPGRKAYYGPMTVKGTKRMDPAFVAWMAGLEEGHEYDPDDIDRANKRLAHLGVFRAARIEEAPSIDPNGLLPLSLTVQERPLHRFGIGGSYSTIDGAALDTYWLHRNLFGHAESLKLEAKIGGWGQTSRSTSFGDGLTYSVGATFIRPGVITRDTDFVASLIGDREVLDQYTRTAVTAMAGFNRTFNDRLSGKLMVEGGPSRFDDDFGTRDFIDAGILSGLTYDSRDKAADATRGIYADFSAEPLYEFHYGNPILRMTAEGRTYYALDPDNRMVLAGRLKLGSIIGPAPYYIPPDRLFFAGGGGSIRGYAYRNIGVMRPDGRVSGGRSLVEASAEIRAHLTDSIGVVGFVDAGYVGAKPFPDFSETFKVGVGAGLRYFTGLGPLRLDVAFPLNRDKNDPSVGIYVGLGQAF